MAVRIKRRDEAAMAELYDEYGALIFSVLSRMAGSRWVAEDLTQEVFMRIWTSIDQFDWRRGSLKSWIVVIARNKGLDYWRSADGRMSRRGCELDELVVPAAREDLDSLLIRVDLLATLRQALQHLTERQQEVLRLAYFEGKTQAEIAENIRAPLGSVKSWVRSGLARLRKLLGPDNIIIAASIARPNAARRGGARSPLLYPELG